MYQNFSISLSSVKLSECGSKTGIKLMSFCECGKRTMMITSSGLWLKVSGIKAAKVNTENGND